MPLPFELPENGACRLRDGRGAFVVEFHSPDGSYAYIGWIEARTVAQWREDGLYQLAGGASPLDLIAPWTSRTRTIIAGINEKTGEVTVFSSFEEAKSAFGIDTVKQVVVDYEPGEGKSTAEDAIK